MNSGGARSDRGDTITPIGTIFLSGFDLNCFPSPRRHTRIVHRHFPKRGIDPRVRDVRLDPAVRRNAARRGRMELRDMCAPIKIIFAARSNTRNPPHLFTL